MPSEAETRGFIGSMVSIDCGQLGSYQGHVQKIDPIMNTLTITHAFHNGLSCDQPEVNLSSTTILDIKIIHSSTEAKEIIDRKTTPSKMTKEIDDVTKPICSSPVKIIKAASKARTAGFASISSTSGSAPIDNTKEKGGHACRRKLSPPDSPSTFVESGGGASGPSSSSRTRRRISKSANREFPESSDQGNGHVMGGGTSGNVGKARGRGGLTGGDACGRKTTAARKVERGGKKGANSRNEECFSAPAESYMQEFDFEYNLALFNKKAVFKEIENEFPDLSLESSPRDQKYRHDENILQPGESNVAGPVTKQQIEVPETKSPLYYTDDGLVVPSISLELRDSICNTAAQYGLSSARQLESYGRAASEMVMHLIGGSHRIHPKNDHQMPVVVVLCGPHNQGALGACCARILASHGVQVTLLLPKVDTLPDSLAQELQLFKMNRGLLIHTVKSIPKTVDLVVSAMDSPAHPNLNQQPWYQAAIAWGSGGDLRAQVLALDPPCQGPAIPAKWSLCKVLPLFPLPTKCGSLYLCDLSIPATVFTEAGIKYISPFGSKFVIPLHPHN